MRAPRIGGPVSNAGWLEGYIEASVARKLCTKMICTTCGAMDFRKGLLVALAQASDDKLVMRMNASIAVAITSELANIGPRGMREYEQAVRLILFDVWHTVGEAELVERLEGTWAGGVLVRMQTHYKKEQERRRAHAEQNDPAVVEKRRQEKKLAKNEKHLARIAAKRERDRVWRENQGKNEG